MEIPDLDHFIAYYILIDDVTILMIKIGVLLNILWNLDSICVLGDVPLSLGRKYLEHHNELFGIIYESPCPLPLGIGEEFIISFIGDKCAIFNLLDDTNMPTWLFILTCPFCFAVT